MTPDGARQRPLTPLQFGMLYHYLREGQSSGTDVVQVEVRLPADPGLEELARAWAVIAARHPSLRIAFDWEGGETPRVVVQPEVTPSVERIHLRKRAADPGAAFEAFLRRDRLRGFDLSRAPAFRVALVELAAAEQDDVELRLVWTLHHALADGASYALVLDELLTLLEGGELPPPVDPAPWHRWLAERNDSADEAWWRRALEGLPDTLRLPRTRGSERSSSGRWVFRSARLDSGTLDALGALAARTGVTVNTLLQGAWGLTLARLHGRDEVVFGQVRGGRAGTVPDAEAMVDLFIRTVPVRARATADRPLGAFFRDLRDAWVGMRGHEHASPERIHQWSGAPAGELLFESVLNVQAPFWGEQLLRREGQFTPRGVDLHNPLVYPLTVAVNLSDEAAIRLEFDPDRLDAQAVEAMLATFEGHLHVFAEVAGADEAGEVRLGELPWLAGAARRRVVEGLNETDGVLPAEETVAEAFEAQVARDPEAPALVAGAHRLSYAELDRMAGAIAEGLRARGIGRGDRVAVALGRTRELVPALLGVAKAGAAWLPLDPTWPAERTRFMLADAGPAALLAGPPSGMDDPSGATEQPVRITVEELLDGGDRAGFGGERARAADVAYILYTSGSTGQPKGVEIEHRNVLNFFAGMDERVGTGPGDRWLAVTSVSFDISVLELLWTLCRGAEVVLHGAVDADGTASSDPGASTGPAHGPAFSLFYFSAEGSEGEAPPAPGRDRYRLLLEGARFADEHGFAAVWTPERHFHPFGGIYPNPSVAGAAIAAITRRVRIRAGSVVLPLHDPIRVAEEWSVVDNLSDGRVDLAFASGWHDRDFILAPERWADRRSGLFEAIDELRELWRGGEVEREGPEGRRHRVSLHPRPVQPTLPVWITAGGSPETFQRAGASGANLLTHLLGQRPEDLAHKIALYREARAEAGHEGPGHVSLMLHTWIGRSEEEVQARVRAPFRNYLRSSVGLLKAVAEGEGLSLGGARLSDDEMEALLDHAFERYYRDSALMGTVERGVEIVRAMAACGVDEIACLIDFGVEDDAVLEGLPRLREVMERAGRPDDAGAPSAGGGASVPAHDPAVPALVSRAILEQEITHLQCTPSQAALILAEDEAAEALGTLRTLCVGGEAFPGTLAERLLSQLSSGARLLNMYGPTETTIWSAVHEVGPADADGAIVPLGVPIANTTLHVVDPRGEPVPLGVEGELLIGGFGVARGYHARPELTAERFVMLPTLGRERLYRSGDRARRRRDGTLEFRGRVDEQIKLRGHRIEPGEIEAVLRRHPGVKQAVVVARGEGPEARLVATFPASAGLPSTAALRRHLAESLPAWMVPAGWEVVPAFPLTPNGKVDRRALAAGVEGRRSLERAEAGAGPTHPGADVTAVAGARNGTGDLVPTRADGARVASLERALRALWGELLEVDEVAPEANFFEVGGHSLLAVRVHARLREGIAREVSDRLSLVDLFRFPTARALAGHLATLGAGGAASAGAAPDPIRAGAGTGPGSSDAEANRVERARARGASRRAALRARAGRGGGAGPEADEGDGVGEDEG